jgi:hypothetical protein
VFKLERYYVTHGKVKHYPEIRREVKVKLQNIDDFKAAKEYLVDKKDNVLFTT